MQTSEMNNLGHILRKLREDKRLPLKTVASNTRIDQAILSKIERGERRIARQQIIKLAKYFNVDETNLLKEWLSDTIVSLLTNEKAGIRTLELAEQKLKINTNLAMINQEEIIEQVLYQSKGENNFRTKSKNKDTDFVYKPIQYLGAKHRPLSEIISQTLQLIKPNTYVLDLFSGSTAVSQILNLNKIDVISNDALSFHSAFANTLLNIYRNEDDLLNIKNGIEKLEEFELATKYIKPFKEIIENEKSLLKSADTKELLSLYSKFQQVGNVKTSIEKITPKQLVYITENPGKSAINNYPLVTNYYAGTYFGIYQSTEIDRLRNGIEILYQLNDITFWQYNYFLTCLLNVCSKIVYTAGKHFAQPIKHSNILGTQILHKRFYEDRLKDVWQEFKKCSLLLSEAAKNNFTITNNIVTNKLMEEIIIDTTTLPEVSVIYADPPYTAQQYSRFYHIPEVIFNYTYPSLQLVNGNVTNGLYPDNKFKSRFCSKSESKCAFEDLFKLAAKLKSSLIISYSSSLSEETGNSRMIELNQILELSAKILPKCKVEVIKFDFKYKQLNTSNNIVHTKDDKEFLIVIKQSI